MLNVECEGCKATYPVDERRIPQTGLKMRCPKCGTSFVVNPPADGRGAGLPAVAAPKGPPPVPTKPGAPIVDLPASLGARPAGASAAGSPGAPAVRHGGVPGARAPAQSAGPPPPPTVPGAPPPPAAPRAPPPAAARAPAPDPVDELDLDLPAALGSLPTRPKLQAPTDVGELDLPSATAQARPKTPAAAARAPEAQLVSILDAD